MDSSRGFTTESAPKASASSKKYLGIGIGVGIAVVIAAIVFLGSFNQAGLSSITSVGNQITIPLIDQDPDKDGLTTDEEHDLGTNPNQSDTDGDGLNDMMEKDRGTNPNARDSDGDGLTDNDEINRGTNALQFDTDSDGLSDREEGLGGTDPLQSDTDRDNLNDGDERNRGTNPLSSDSDGDSLNDGREISIGTNPLRQNTDGDRYDDADDPRPIQRNTASIGIDYQSFDINYNWVNLGLIAVGIGALAPDLEIASAEIDFSLENIGSDYTSYVRYDGVFELSGTEIARISDSAGRLDVGQTLNKHFTYQITLSDIPSFLIDALSNENSQITFEIQNLSFEKY